ncbi:MAG: hypothetical protein WAX89_00495 [Alphaproteobacteria bacterium]
MHTLSSRQHILAVGYLTLPLYLGLSLLLMIVAAADSIKLGMHFEHALSFLVQNLPSWLCLVTLLAGFVGMLAGMLWSVTIFLKYTLRYTNKYHSLLGIADGTKIQKPGLWITFRAIALGVDILWIWGAIQVMNMFPQHTIAMLPLFLTFGVFMVAEHMQTLATRKYCL